MKNTVKETGKIWSINFFERFHVAAVAKAEELVNEGKIGKVNKLLVQVHRRGNYERPDWFYNRESYGGIITDIGSHQLSIFSFTNSNRIIQACISRKYDKERNAWFSRFR